MAGKDIIEMSLNEVKRLKAVQEAIDRHITQKMAAAMIGLSERQVRRLVRAVRVEGDRGIAHKTRGRLSNRRIPDKIRDRALRLYKRKYCDFGPTLASEKLSEMDGIGISDETVRSGSWRRASGRRRESGGLTDSGGPGRSVLARWCRWMAPIMIGLKAGVRS